MSWWRKTRLEKYNEIIKEHNDEQATRRREASEFLERFSAPETLKAVELLEVLIARGGPDGTKASEMLEKHKEAHCLALAYAMQQCTFLPEQQP